ncbi:unnamed protein product [Euphydryas editha]|uniref:Pecanex-like protein n=1 Tax=Euphydryas editha TaxID=104508 RepID=A0AAU9TWZ0_EUPED|nr:unnamed protein product [Euphydryas editha]
MRKWDKMTYACVHESEENLHLEGSRKHSHCYAMKYMVLYSIVGIVVHVDCRVAAEARREERAARRERGQRARTQPCNRTRVRREIALPASFRLLAASDNLRPLDPADPRMGDDGQNSTGGWEFGFREQPRRAASAKVSGSRGSGSGSSLEEASGLDVSLPDCKIIANRNARQASFHRYFINEGTSKDLSKLSKDIRHERESYRELTGRYIEKPEVIPLKETHYSDISNKETVLKKEVKKDPKPKEIKTKIKRSDSGRSELKANISVGSKVLIVEPLGVYDCINLGRRIDVLWPSEYQRERGGRNYWGSWVPMAGMDGLVVHKWSPNHRDPKLRSHVDKSILLLQLEDRFVPIAESCVQDLGDEV